MRTIGDLSIDELREWIADLFVWIRTLHSDPDGWILQRESDEVTWGYAFHLERELGDAYAAMLPPDHRIVAESNARDCVSFDGVCVACRSADAFGRGALGPALCAKCHNEGWEVILRHNERIAR